ncbi:MAG: LexA family transcriptional regulator, partial [Kamptonema sp. SIO4C4]|nr:LexA family transcriptional regulator [Kamptonema sp. SIO4C4]
IAAGGLVEPFSDIEEELDLSTLCQQPDCFALRVTGDSMIEDMIREGDFVIMQKPPANETPKDGTIVAARVDGSGTTLKRYYQEGEKIILKPSNPQYNPIEAKASQVEIQGVLVGVWRGYNARQHLRQATSNVPSATLGAV